MTGLLFTPRPRHAVRECLGGRKPGANLLRRRAGGDITVFPHDRPRRARRLLAIVVTGAVLGVASCGGDDGRRPASQASDTDAVSKEAATPRPDHTTIVRVDAVSGEVRDVFPAGPYPLHLVVASGHVWVQNFGDGTLTHVDPTADTSSTGDIDEVAGVASDGTDLWVARDGNVLARHDGMTGEEELAIRLARRQLFAPGRAGFVAVGGGSIWATIPPAGQRSEELWRIDARSREIVARIRIGTEANPPLSHGGYLWVITRDDQALTRVDMRTNEARRVEVGRYPWSLAAGAGSLWISHHVDAKVVRFRPDNAEPQAEFKFDTNPRGLAYGRGKLWVATEDSLHAIAAGTNEVALVTEFGPFAPDTGPIGVAVIEGSIWLSIE